MPNQYESAQSALGGEENKGVDDVEMQQMADDNAREGGDELEAAQQNAGRYKELPNAADIQTLNEHAKALSDRTIELQQKLSSMQNEYTQKVDTLHNELATLNQRRLRNVKVSGMLFGVLGVSVVAGGSVLGCYLGGLFEHADKAPTPAVPAKVADPTIDKDADSMTTVENADVVMETTLDQWAKLPNEMLWAAVEKDAFASGKEWSIHTWAFVTGYMDGLMQRMASSGRMPNYSKHLVSDAVVNSDYTSWKDENDLTSRWLFDNSVTYAELDQDGVSEIAERGVRMNYLARMFKKASEMLEDDGV